jgi:mRNA interferase RelE/StbE
MAPRDYRLRVPGEIRNLVRGLHPDLKRKVRASLEAIVTDPSSGKGLRDELTGLRSYRVGHFRIIYRIAARGRIVELVTVGPRARVYEDTLRFIQRAQDVESRDG